MKIFFPNRKINYRRGFTLIEVLMGTLILSLVCLSIYSGFNSVIKTVRSARVKTDAMLLANEQIEIARNLSYQDVGIIAGLPAGKIPHEQILTRGGNTFKLVASVRNIDDPFDGLLGSTTKNDLAPADYKQLQIDISCLNCGSTGFPLQKIYTVISPKNLETTTGNGSLFVRVFNSVGDPVSEARVQINNNSGTTSISVDEVSDNNGNFQLVDTPPGAQAYHIAVSKTGYSSDQTYSVSANNPNPLVSPATVLGGQLTQTSFIIDKLSHLRVKTLNNACHSLSGVSLRVLGQKKIGQNPDVPKYDHTFNTDSGGVLDLPNLEWDTYNLLVATSSSRFLVGSSSFLPYLLSPDTIQDIYLILSSAKPNALLVTVGDVGTGLPLSEAEVIIGGKTVLTSQGFFNQTDWSGGAGQTSFEIENMFETSNSNIDFSSSSGELKLRFSLGHYLSNGEIISSIFDTGATSTQYVSLRFRPADQATSTGETSVRLQLASGNELATSTWNFLGPDGTPSTYYTAANETINAIHNYDRYIRYKLFLNTENNLFTPNISDIGLTFTSECTPPGQAYFENLSSGPQTITVNRSGYKSYTSTVDIQDLWQRYNVVLEPQ